MSQRSPDAVPRVRARRVALTLLFLLASLPLFPQEAVVNAIKGIKTVPDGVEIELTSTKPFPVRNEVAILRIGKAEFTRSRPPADGSLNTLIFTLTASQFAAQTASGDKVSLQYGRSEAEFRWDFGRLDKAVLDRP